MLFNKSKQASHKKILANYHQNFDTGKKFPSILDKIKPYLPTIKELIGYAISLLIAYIKQRIDS